MPPIAITSVSKVHSVGTKTQTLEEITLRSIMRDTAERANLAGRETNHSARKTTCTKLLHAGIVSTTIQQLTGHINVQSVKNYAIASVEMQKTPKIMLQTQNNMLYVQFQLTRHVQIRPRIPSLPLRCQRSHPMHRSINHYQHEN